MRFSVGVLDSPPSLGLCRIHLWVPKDPQTGTTPEIAVLKRIRHEAKKEMMFMLTCSTTLMLDMFT